MLGINFRFHHFYLGKLLQFSLPSFPNLWKWGCYYYRLHRVLWGSNFLVSVLVLRIVLSLYCVIVFYYCFLNSTEHFYYILNSYWKCYCSLIPKSLTVNFLLLIRNLSSVFCQRHFLYGCQPFSMARVTPGIMLLSRWVRNLLIPDLF